MEGKRKEGIVIVCISLLGKEWGRDWKRVRVFLPWENKSVLLGEGIY